MLTSLRRYRNFRLYFAGQIVSYSGSWMQDTALPWLVLQLTHSPFQVGLLVFCRYGPFMVGGLYGGVIADRFDNRRILMCTQTLAMCVAAGLAAVAFTGTSTLWLLYLLATGTGVALVFDNPSKHALIYRLVGRDEIANAVSLNVSLQNAAKIVGPAIGGILIAAVGSGWCFVVNAASFLAVLAALAAMRASELLPVRRGERQGGLRALREGVAYAQRSPLLLTILALGIVLGLFGFSTIRTLLSVLAKETLHGTARTFGALFAAYGAGAVVGALASAARARTGRRWLLAGALLFSAPLAALAPVRVTILAGVLLFLVGCGWATWSGQALAQVQLAAPDQLRGRVISLYTYTIIASAPLGGLLGGWLADVGGTTLAFAVCGGVSSAAVVVGAATLRRQARADAGADARGEVGVDGVGALAPFLDRPDDERLPTSAVAGGEDIRA
jgi:predicted MFS family arabinose efflux permease